MTLDTTTAKNPLIKLADQLSEQSAAVHAVLQKQIEGMVPGDPDDRKEFDTAKEIFAENRQKIEALLEMQATIMEELLDLSEEACKPSEL
jgi:BMFP domain-containing protein YqiC